MLASIIEKCFKIKEQAHKIQLAETIDLDVFITKVEEQVERISEIDWEMDRSSLQTSSLQPKPMQATTDNRMEEEKKEQPRGHKSIGGRNTALRMKSWLIAKKGGYEIKDNLGLKSPTTDD